MKSTYLIVQVLTMIFTATNVQSQTSIERRATLYEPMIVASASRNGVDPYLLWTIAYLESRFRPEAVSYKNGKPCARGMMQFVEGTARRYGLSNPHNPSEAIEAGGRYVRDLMVRFDGRVDLVLAAYNAGEGTVEAFLFGKKLQVNGRVINPRAIRTGGIPPYAETRRYVAQGILLYGSVAARLPAFSRNNSTLRTDVHARSRDSLYFSNSYSIPKSSQNIAKASLSVYAQ